MKEKYERETNKQWTEVEDHMVEICNFYEYSFSWDESGKIDIRSYCGHLTRYNSAEDMVKDWKAICKRTNDDYLANSLPKPFPWLTKSKK